MLRLWSVVLASNVIGATLAATFIAYGGALQPALVDTIAALSHEALADTPLALFARAIPAGVLVAALVWMLPSSRNAALPVIVTFTWLIAAGGFAHIVAGSVEMAFLVVTGSLSLQAAAFGFFLPVLAGNVVGGTFIFSLLAYGQVRHELS